VSTLSQVNGENSKISTFEAADNALFVATIGFSGPAITSYQQENLHNALFDNKNEDKTEEDHWKDVSIMMEGAKTLAKVQPAQAEMRFMRTKSQVQVKGSASVVVKAMKEAFKWVVKMLKAAMKKAVDIMKAAFAKLQELAKKAFEQSLE
jgi:hypothetical protein